VFQRRSGVKLCPAPSAFKYYFCYGVHVFFATIANAFFTGQPSNFDVLTIFILSKTASMNLKAMGLSFAYGPILGRQGLL